MSRFAICQQVAEVKRAMFHITEGIIDRPECKRNKSSHEKEYFAQSARMRTPILKIIYRQPNKRQRFQENDNLDKKWKRSRETQITRTSDTPAYTLEAIQ